MGTHNHDLMSDPSSESVMHDLNTGQKSPLNNRARDWQEQFNTPPVNHKPHVNRKEVRVIGMSRSGNHAIINWILSQADGRTCFLNCVEGKTNPFTSARPLHSGLPYQANYREFDWEQEQIGQFSKKDLLLYSYEDNFLGYVCHPLFEQNHDRWVGSSLQRFDILILRDPFNLFASRLRAGKDLSPISVATAVRIWKQHARECIGQSRHLNQSPVLINYNRWVTEPPYRQQLAVKLGLNFTDASINTVHKTAGGSSFDGSHYDGHASRMKVLERWKFYQNDPTYQQILHPELVTYGMKLFAPLPGVERLLETAAHG
jgi:hypothetical protein